MGAVIVTSRDIINAIEQVAPRRLQEDYDNTGLQCGTLDVPCTGVLLCVDVTVDIVAEARERGCNLIVSHHPLLFRAVKQVTGKGRVQAALVAAIKADVAVYSCHTAVDNAPEGISHVMARRLGLQDVEVLENHSDMEFGTVGSGVVGNLGEAITPEAFVALVKHSFGSPVARCSDPSDLPAGKTIRRVGLCGGAGSFLIDRAAEMGADAYLTSDSKFNCFLDCAHDIFLVDIGHYESEECAKEIFYHVITKKFPNFAVYYSQIEKNPIKYL